MKLFLVVFLLAIALLQLAGTPSYAACTGQGTKRVATADNQNAGNKWGNFAQSTPVSTSRCGSSWAEGSYVHLATVVWTDIVQEDFIEVMWYNGYAYDGWSSTSLPAYQWIKGNDTKCGGRQASNISGGTGLYPSWNDNIEMTLRYDWTDANGIDYYKIVIWNLNKGHGVTITNLCVDGRGQDAYLQSETFSLQNNMRGKQYFADYMTTSYTWVSWTTADTWKFPSSDSDNRLCIQEVTNDQFKFGTIISGSCWLP